MSLTEITIYAIIGIASAGLAKRLDMSMQYGHILGFVRYWLAMFYANRLKNGFPEVLQKGKEVTPFEDRSEYFSDVYWDIATQSHWFTAWICIWCISVWMWIFTSAGYILMSNMSKGDIIGYLIISFASCTIAIVQIEKESKTEVYMGSDETEHSAN